MLDPALATTVVAASTRPESRDHGEQHWKAVAWAGHKIASATPGADPELVLLFALFHDSMRHNEFHDPEHGERGGALARSMCGTHFELDSARLELLVDACTRHDRGQVSDDPTIGACWDADRVNLWRVGITPDPKLLSTAAAPDLVAEARQFHHQTFTWPELFVALGGA